MEETGLDNANPHPLEKRGSQLSDYGLSHVVLERMKIKRVLSAMEKVCLSHKIFNIYNLQLMECSGSVGRVLANEVASLRISGGTVMCP